jgi:hypothetical protein
VKALWWVAAFFGILQLFLVVQACVGITFFHWHRTSDELGILCLNLVEGIVFAIYAICRRNDRKDQS